ncbi:hypothetical protein V6N12_075549 [Hibiscus sabdariffa]|uniref:Uncharacterized protein n=1 Tax=Hibiscus sabdariffa TaxID=183260 RepID=A0ABR2C7W3_9ROSI
MSAPTLITGEHDENSFDITENRGQPGNRLVLGIPIVGFHQHEDCPAWKLCGSVFSILLFPIHIALKATVPDISVTGALTRDPSALAIPSLEDGHTNRTESCSRFHVDVVKPCLSAKWFVTSYMQLLQHVDGGGQS